MTPASPEGPDERLRKQVVAALIAEGVLYHQAEAASDAVLPLLTAERERARDMEIERNALREALRRVLERAVNIADDALFATDPGSTNG